MGFEAIAIAAGLGALGYSAMSKKTPNPKPTGAPPTPIEAGEETAKKRKQYRPAAQVFRDEDLRLGMSGKLGL